MQCVQKKGGKVVKANKLCSIFPDVTVETKNRVTTSNY